MVRIRFVLRVLLAAVIVASAVSCARNTQVLRATKLGDGQGQVVVKTEADSYRLLLVGKGSPIEIVETNKPHILPAASYRLASLRLEKANSAGIPWQLWGDRRVSLPVDVRERGTTELEVGAPLEASVTANRRGGAYLFQFVLEGRGGEQYTAANVRRAGKLAAPPEIVIRDAAGEVVGSGAFRYG